MADKHGENKSDFALRAGLEAAAALQPVTVSSEALAETATFVTRRLQGVLAEMGFAFDVVEAVLARRGDNPYAALRAVFLSSACNCLARAAIPAVPMLARA